MKIVLFEWNLRLKYSDWQHNFGDIIDFNRKEPSVKPLQSSQHKFLFLIICEQKFKL